VCVVAGRGGGGGVCACVWDVGSFTAAATDILRNNIPTTVLTM
jgi:hypothetical protein